MWVVATSRRGAVIVLPKESVAYTNDDGYAAIVLYRSHLVTNYNGDSLKYDIVITKSGYDKYEIKNYVIPDSSSNMIRAR